MWRVGKPSLSLGDLGGQFIKLTLKRTAEGSAVHIGPGKHDFTIWRLVGLRSSFSLNWAWSPFEHRLCRSIVPVHKVTPSRPAAQE